MATNQPSSEVRTRLHAIAERLKEAHHLGPEARRELAELVDELGKALEASAAPSAETAHLTESAAHLLQALHEPHDASLLASAKQRLDQAVFDTEAHAPFVAGIARRLLEALANLGI